MRDVRAGTSCFLTDHFMKLLAKNLSTASFSWTSSTLSGDGGVSVARIGQDKLTPVSVAVTDQMIGLFVSALFEMHVTMP